MKHFLFILAIIAGLQTLHAQTPQAINYQAVARDKSGTSISGKTLSLRLSIEDASGKILYQETQSATTNNFGLFSLAIGKGKVVSGTFSSIDWSKGSRFLQVEIDSANTSNYVQLGTTEMQAVPYALYAENSGGSIISNWTISGDNIFNNNKGMVMKSLNA